MLQVGQGAFGNFIQVEGFFNQFSKIYTYFFPQKAINPQISSLRQVPNIEMDPGVGVQGILYQLDHQNAVISVKGGLKLCDVSLFFKENQPCSASDLVVGIPLRVYFAGDSVKAVHIVARRSMDPVTLGRTPQFRHEAESWPGKSVFQDSASDVRQEAESYSMPRRPGFQAPWVPRPSSIINTPENMKTAYDSAKGDEVFSVRIFPMWILSEDIGRNQRIVENMEKIEGHFSGFRRMNRAENAFFRAVAVGLMQGILFSSTPQACRTLCLNILRLPILSKFAHFPAPLSPLRTLTSLRDDKNLWSILTDRIQSIVTSYIRSNQVLACYVTEEDFNLNETSQVLITATAEALRIQLEVYSPRDSCSKVTSQVIPPTIQVALIKEGDCYYPLLTLRELIEGGYDVYTCSFQDDLPSLHSPKTA